MEERSVTNRTAIACTAVLVATMVACTVYVTHVIKEATLAIISDDSDDDEAQEVVLPRA
jgi:hypothetical protein